MLGEHPATIIDLSIGGAALVADFPSANVGHAYALIVTLGDGREIKAPFTVRNVSEIAPGRIRLGGSVDWGETGWLAEYLNLSFAGVRPAPQAFAFSPLL
jgi:hypothetical protein